MSTLIRGATSRYIPIILTHLNFLCLTRQSCAVHVGLLHYMCAQLLKHTDHCAESVQQGVLPECTDETRDRSARSLGKERHDVSHVQVGATALAHLDLERHDLSAPIVSHDRGHKLRSIRSPAVPRSSGNI